jgi:hypothetical protein
MVTKSGREKTKSTHWHARTWLGFASRRTDAEITALREGIVDIVTEFEPVTCRQVFYLCVGRGLVEKTENECGSVDRLLIEMRRNGTISYDSISDSGREIKVPQAYDGLGDMLNHRLSVYRRHRWEDQDCYLGFHVEKATLESLFWDITAEFGVPLFITHGFSSITFAHDIAEDIEASGRPAVIYSFTDNDPSGPLISKALERAIRDCAPDVDLTFERVCLTAAQVEEWRLPERPTKRGGTHAKGFKGKSCELDSIPPDQFRDFIQQHIDQHIDTERYDAVVEAEKADKAKLRRFTKRMERS